jgi:hypothetical protein
MNRKIRLAGLALLTLGWAISAQAQVPPPNDETAPTRQAPIGHRQPTPDSVGKAAVERGTNPTPQPQSQGRDFGNDLSICRGC